MRKSIFGLIVWSIIVLVGVITAPKAFAETNASAAESYRTTQNHGVVGIMGGSLTGTYSKMASEMGKALDDSDLRVVTMIGKGSLTAAGDLLYLKGVDAAILQADVLDFIKKFDVFPGAESNLAYIAKMFNEEVHLVARKEINSIQDLEGKKVSFGPSTSGGFMTASVIFDELGVTVEAQDMSHDDGLRALQNGEIEAMIRVSGAPVKFLSEVSWEHNLHIVPLPAIGGSSYVRSTVTAEQYPGLIPQGKSIETVAVVAILAAYNWPADHERRKKVEKFVNELTNQLPKLKDETKYHPKWEQVDLEFDIPGWTAWEPVGF